ncbi:hypothetical protein F4677DRAFT_462956 [Hypoxylon crocopeplum]|nr:hypothetical protein F4677DRAFT_462956 [Hypoxylon crocopeplum]
MSALHMELERKRLFEKPLSDYFANERSKAWNERLEDYWARTVQTLATENDRILLEPYRKQRIGREFHGFMCLPREIRDIIYEYCLVEDFVLLPDIHGELSPKEKKTIGFLCGVNSTVHAEATYIFYGRNRFVFPKGPCAFLMEAPPPYYNIPPTFYKQLTGRMRSVALIFDLWDPTLHAKRSDRILQSSCGIQIPPLNGSDEASHSRWATMTVDIWRDRINSIKDLALDRLHIELDQCYCPLGCCRLVNNVLDALSHADHEKPWKFHPPRVIEVTGWLDEGEAMRIEERLEALYPNTPHDVRFYGGSAFERLQGELQEQLRNLRKPGTLRRLNRTL